MTDQKRDRPWLMRTYAGHSTAEDSNALYRRNLAKGQTGLSVAFDLPTQTGYDSDHILARGEVGRVGVPVGHVGDMRTLFDGIPLEQTNTSMTINATAMWMLALYQVVAEEQGADIARLTGTTQNDIVKEYLSRGTHVFPPGPSVRLITDMIAYTVGNIPKWNPINICSYHLQEAGATPVQEIAYAMCTAIEVLDAVRDSGQVPAERMGEVVARISFFVNAGVRFVEEMCKMRAFGRPWEKVTRERYGIEDPKQRRFRYGVQVNSLGLTEAQPENNVQRIVLEMLAVTLSKDARARAVQLPAWNEALGLPRPWDQQWSLRIQQVLAFESDLLEYGDLFNGSEVIEAKTAELLVGAEAEIAKVLGMGGVIPAVESGYLKSNLVASHAARRARIESGEDRIIGVNCFDTTEESPLTADLDTAIMVVDPASEQSVLTALEAWRGQRDEAAALRALEELKAVSRHHREPRRRPPWPAPGPASPPASGPSPCARCSASTGRPPASAAPRSRSRPSPAASWPPSARRSPRPPPNSAPASCGCWSASPAWTGTPTGPNRSPSGPAMPGSRWSTRASGSPPSRSSRPPSPRTSTAWACRSSPAPTPSWCRTCCTGCAGPGWRMSR